MIFASGQHLIISKDKSIWQDSSWPPKIPKERKKSEFFACWVVFHGFTKSKNKTQSHSLIP